MPRELKPAVVSVVAVVGSDFNAIQIAKRFNDRRIPVTLLAPPQPGEQVGTPTAFGDVRVGATYSDVRDAGLVMINLTGEALSSAIFELDAVCSGDAVFAICTPKVNVLNAASLSKNPQRTLGLHF